MATNVPLPPPGFDALSVEEKLDYLESLWDRVMADASAVPVPDWHRGVLADRSKDFHETPDAGSRWEVVQERIRQDIRNRR